jgi:hypothetical protein
MEADATALRLVEHAVACSQVTCSVKRFSGYPRSVREFGCVHGSS